jgi:hypothetical protein
MCFGFKNPIPRENMPFEQIRRGDDSSQNLLSDAKILNLVFAKRSNEQGTAPSFDREA